MKPARTKVTRYTLLKALKRTMQIAFGQRTTLSPILTPLSTRVRIFTSMPAASGLKIIELGKGLTFEKSQICDIQLFSPLKVRVITNTQFGRR